MESRILLVRHGRSEANEAGVWQGQGDSPLADVGADQAKALAQRLDHLSPAKVISSNLRRAAATAEALGWEVAVDPGWKEMDLGTWEGATFEEALESHPETLKAIRDGEPLRFGETGETIPDFEERILAVFDDLAENLNAGDTAVVVTHGGAIDAVAARFLGRVPGRRAYPIVTNTSLTEIVRGRRGWRIVRFNDALHLDDRAGFLGKAGDEGYEVVGLARHGVTAANREHRIQGQQCWGLHDDGHSQAKALAERYPRPDRLFASPLRRALETASAFGLDPAPDDRLMELSFGEWEGKRDADLEEDPLSRQIFEMGMDLARGHSGETFAELIQRVTAFLDDLDVVPGRRTMAVSHGGTIRAGIASVLGRGHDIHRSLGAVPNTSVTHLALDGPDVRQAGRMLIDVAVTPEV